MSILPYTVAFIVTAAHAYHIGIPTLRLPLLNKYQFTASLLHFMYCGMG
jgi:hypothetical protein